MSSGLPIIDKDRKVFDNFNEVLRNLEEVYNRGDPEKAKALEVYRKQAKKRIVDFVYWLKQRDPKKAMTFMVHFGRGIGQRRNFKQQLLELVEAGDFEAMLRHCEGHGYTVDMSDELFKIFQDKLNQYGKK